MFKEALENTLSHEGYYANVTGDRGGETYRGIARNFFPAWPGWKIVDLEKQKKGGTLPWNYRIHNPQLDELIAAFYKFYFWDKIYLDLVNDSNVQNFIFDFFVNSRNSGIKVIQRTLRDVFNKDIDIDGQFGPQTINAVNGTNGKALFEALKKAREVFYKKIATYGDNAKFLRGWLRRLKSFEYKDVATIYAIAFVSLALAGFYMYKNNMI